MTIQFPIETFNTIYTVDFKDGNLTPSFDSYGWGDMRVTPPLAAPNNSKTFHYPNGGLQLEVTRAKTPNNDAPPARCALYVLTPNLTQNSRIRTRIEFDMPTAAGFNSAGELVALEPIGPPPAEVPTRPEPWAVVLSVSPRPDVAGPMVFVTCQFNKLLTPGGGVRLNTPFALQTDKGPPLVWPLSYGAMTGYGLKPIPFTLEHDFCGWNAVDLDHIVGSGHLATEQFDTIGLPGGPRQDWRVYSSDVFNTQPSQNPAPIGALAATLAITGMGAVGITFHRFTVLQNLSLPQN